MDLRFFQLPAAFVVVGIASTVSGACFQPEDTFDNFGERYDKIDDASDPSATATVSTGIVGCVPPAAESTAGGDYLFVLSAQLIPEKPIFFRATVTFGADPAAPTFSMSLQPLRTPYREGDDNAGIPIMSEVGAALPVGPFTLNAQGQFEAQLPEALTVDGKANPYSPNALEATIKLDSGQICELNPGDPRNCIGGPVSGEVTKPIPLTLDKVNLYTMLPYDGTTLPDPLVYTCDGSLVADPFP